MYCFTSESLKLKSPKERSHLGQKNMAGKKSHPKKQTKKTTEKLETNTPKTNSALINPCRGGGGGGGVVADPPHQSSREERSHTAVLVPQRLAVLWVHRLLRIIYTHTFSILWQSGRTGPQLTICLAVWGLVWEGNVAVRGRGM